MAAYFQKLPMEPKGRIRVEAPSVTIPYGPQGKPPTGKYHYYGGVTVTYCGPAQDLTSDDPLKRWFAQVYEVEMLTPFKGDRTIPIAVSCCGAWLFQGSAK